ncbi:MAG: nitroreductase family protein [Nanoarchaeota archaeon]|nr:nitroreductase family protein [Nanoarchaeota archaeon]
MDVKEAIKNRKSIRKYKQDPVPEEHITELVDAARLAPSGNNAQPWRFRVLKTKEEIDILKKHRIAIQDFVYTAPLIIVCCGDPKAFVKSKGIDDSNEKRALRDVSIGTAYMTLRAEELGLGSCYVGWIDKKKIKEVLGLPEEYIVPYLITFGYPEGESKPLEKKRIDEVIV